LSHDVLLALFKKCILSDWRLLVNLCLDLLFDLLQARYASGNMKDRNPDHAGGTMDREQVIIALRKASVNNRLACETAHTLSRELNVPLSEIGKICNELKIRITACRLGCF
jgi:hypothetical protein